MSETIQLDIWDADFWSRLADIALRIGGELWLGSGIVGAIVAIPTNVLTRKVVTRYRRHRQEK